MSYVVEVERNYETLQNCLKTLLVSRSLIFHNAQDAHLELARKMEEKYNIKAHLTKYDRGAWVWETLEFKSEQDYLLWIMKYS